jgi:hypothetical protein
MLWRGITGLQCCGGLPKDEEAADRARLEQHSTAQHSTTRHGTARHSTAQRGCAVLPTIVTPVGPHLPVSGPHRAGCGRRYDRFREDRRAAAAPHRLLISGGSGGHSCSGAACVPLHAPLALLAASAQLHLIEPRLEDLRGQPSRCQSDGARRRSTPTEHADGARRRRRPVHADLPVKRRQLRRKCLRRRAPASISCQLARVALVERPCRLVQPEGGAAISLLPWSVPPCEGSVRLSCAQMYARARDG